MSDLLLQAASFLVPIASQAGVQAVATEAGKEAVTYAKSILSRIAGSRRAAGPTDSLSVLDVPAMAETLRQAESDGLVSGAELQRLVALASRAVPTAGVTFTDNDIKNLFVNNVFNNTTFN